MNIQPIRTHSQPAGRPAGQPATLAWKCRSHSTARWAFFATRRCRFCLPVTDPAEVPRGLLS